MASKKLRMVVGAGLLTFILVGLLVTIVNRPSEPRYAGTLLTHWLDGSMLTNCPTGLTTYRVLASVGPEAIPWLIVFVRKEEGAFARQYLNLYSRNRLVRRWFPQPWLQRYRTARFNGISLLSRLAPGTEFEGAAVDALLSIDPRSEPQLDGLLLYACGRCTNYSERIVPILLTGLTNPATFDTSLAGLRRFGTKSVPALTRMAKAESGFIRPAELALEKIDEAAYLKLRSEKQNGGP